MTSATARPTQGAITNADRPAKDSTRKISSGAYATDDMASEANTGRAMRLGSSVWLSLSLRNGRPRSNRRTPIETLDTRAKGKPYPRWR